MISAWWFIPAIVTALGLGTIIVSYIRSFGKWMGGLNTLMLAFPVMFIVAGAWFLGALYK